MDRDEDAGDGLGPIPFVLHSHLGLSVGPQVGDQPFPAYPGETFGEAVGQQDRQGHQLRGLVDREPEHDPLVTCPLLVDPDGDVGTLTLDQHLDVDAVGVEGGVDTDVADLPDGVPSHLGVVDPGAGSGLPCHHHLVGGDQRFACHLPLGVLGEDGVEYCIGDGVGHLVGVPFGDGFGTEEPAASHGRRGGYRLKHRGRPLRRSSPTGGAPPRSW